MIRIEFDNGDYAKLDEKVIALNRTTYYANKKITKKILMNGINYFKNH